MHVLDASRSVPVAQTLLDKKRNMCAALSLRYVFLLFWLFQPDQPSTSKGSAVQGPSAGAVPAVCDSRGPEKTSLLLPTMISCSFERCILPNGSFACPLVPLILFSCSRAFVEDMTEDYAESGRSSWRQNLLAF